MEQYANAVSTTLAFDITAVGDTSITVSSATGFPSGPNFRILVGGTELMLVTGVSGVTWTVTRGIENTTPSTFSAGATVEHLITAGAMAQIRADGFNSGPYANAPTSPATGAVYVPTDSFYDFLRYNGSSWDHFRNGRLLTPPVPAQFSWDNIGNSTISTTTGASILFSSQAVSGQLNVRYKTAPATPYTITMGYLAHWWFSNTNHIGLCWRDGAGKIVAYAPTAYYNATVWRVSKWNSTTSYSADYTTGTILPVVYHGPMIWARISNDGVNRTCHVSVNGINWSQLHTTTVNDYITTSSSHYVGFYSGDINADCGITVLHWKET